MKRFYIHTLGCKVNQYESQAIWEAWEHDGWKAVAAPSSAEIILINTCAVTARAVADLRSAIRRLREAAPDARLLVTGCAAGALADEVGTLPGVSAIFGQENKMELARMAREDAGEAPEPKSAPEKLEAAFPGLKISGYGRSRAVVKIQDGCSHRCTYCIVPQARGAAVSRPLQDILDEIRRLLQSGFREIVLSGINLRQYTMSEAGSGDFWTLVSRLEREFATEWANRLRFRISSLEPGQLDARALECLAASKLVAPHLHLSLQSGSRDVLKAMGRGHYHPEGILGFLEELTTIWPVFGLGADIIAGFPGETELQFQDTLRLCADLPLTYSHVFPYSPRPGTAAALMPGQVPQTLRKERAARLRQLVRRKKDAFLREMSKQPGLTVVFEDREIGQGDVGRAAKLMTSSDDIHQGLRGVSEYYTECLLPLEAVRNEVPSRILTKVTPTGLWDGTVLVRLA